MADTPKVIVGETKGAPVAQEQKQAPAEQKQTAVHVVTAAQLDVVKK